MLINEVVKAHGSNVEERYPILNHECANIPPDPIKLSFYVVSMSPICGFCIKKSCILISGLKPLSPGSLIPIHFLL